jgi:uncharacterized protein YegL
MHDDDRYYVLPTYAVCDESESMSGDPIDAVNRQFKPLHDQITSDFEVCDIAHLGIISFSSTAQVLLPLSDLSSVEQLPGLTANGSTNYAAAFSLLRQQIAADAQRLTNEGYTVLRPAVFFFSDGHPNGPEWKTPYSELVDEGFRQHPNMIAFGFGQADEHVIAQVGTLAAYQANDNVDAAEAVRKWAKALTESIVASATAIKQGAASFVPPATPSGYTAISPVPLDVVS